MFEKEPHWGLACGDTSPGQGIPQTWPTLVDFQHGPTFSTPFLLQKSHLLSPDLRSKRGPG